jgi:N4-gp56 family major capsid protein
MATMTTVNNPAAVNEWFDSKLLYRAKQQIAYEKVAQQRGLKSRSGKTIVFRRYNALSLAKVPLVEGHAPTGSTVDHDDIQATILPYGDFIEMTDFVQLTIDHPLANEYADLLGQQAGETLDSLTADEAVAGSNVSWGGGVAGRGSLVSDAQKIDQTILDRAIRLLDSNNSRRFTPQINAGQGQNTYPISKGYWGIVHPDVYFTLRHIPGWKDIIEYASQGSVMDGEVGAYRDIRFLMTTLAPIVLEGGGAVSGSNVKGITNTDVYQTVIFARDSIGVVPLQGNNLRMINKSLGSSGAADPLDQLATMGWKHFGTRKILNDNFLVRLETTATLLTP